MKVLDYLLPFKLYLTIFQLEEYKIPRFYKWLAKNLLRRELPRKKGLIVTTKIKLVIFISILWFLLFLEISLLLSAFSLLQPYLLYTLALLALKPYEIWNKNKVVQKTRAKIDNQKKLRVVGITGSYAKTSVKEILSVQKVFYLL